MVVVGLFLPVTTTLKVGTSGNSPTHWDVHWDSNALLSLKSSAKIERHPKLRVTFIGLPQISMTPAPPREAAREAAREASREAKEDGKEGGKNKGKSSKTGRSQRPGKGTGSERRFGVVKGPTWKTVLERPRLGLVGAEDVLRGSCRAVHSSL